MAYRQPRKTIKGETKVGDLLVRNNMLYKIIKIKKAKKGKYLTLRPI